MKKTAILIITLLSLNCVFGQLVTVKGKITAFREFPVKNVKIQSKKYKTRALTNEAGEFEIKCKKNDVLSIISQGFEKVNYKVRKTDKLVEINLVFKDSKKNREYVVGYGMINEDNLTYAISNLSHENNDFSSYSNLSELIRAKFPTVQVNGGCVIVRGVSSTGSNCALFVVDGMSVANLSGVEPSDIKSINILKDAAASIYGTQGANGVVLIETLRRKSE